MLGNECSPALESLAAKVAELEIESQNISHIIGRSSDNNNDGFPHRTMADSSEFIQQHYGQNDPEPLGALLARRNELATILLESNENGPRTSGVLSENKNKMDLTTAAQQLHDLDRQITNLKSQLSHNPKSDVGTCVDFGGNKMTNSNNRTVQLTLNKLGTGKIGEAPGITLLRKADQMPETSMVSFNSDMDNSASVSDNGTYGQHGCQRVEVIYSLLSMLSSQDRLDSSQTLLLMARAADTCQLMRQSGCVPILIQLLHPGDVWAKKPTSEDVEVLSSAAEALQNLVQNQSDEKRRKREIRVLKLLDQIRAYTLHLRLVHAGMQKLVDGVCAQELGPAVSLVMKLSFDEHHRHTTTQLGGLEAVAELLISDHLVFGIQCPESSVMIRKFVGMALTNLTFGDLHSKQTLCRFPKFLEVVNAQIDSPLDGLRQVFASVLRNLSWKAEAVSKQALRDSGSVTSLVRAAIQAQKESTLKSVLSALWNLSAHCSENKAEICRIPGALDFLVSTLTYRSPSRSMAVVENGGGILRNVSSCIAVSEEYRHFLRSRNCFQILLKHLTSSSLTIVSNACGTLWNLSARSGEDQRLLWQLGAVPMLRSLVHSKHKMISMGSAAALKNLLSNRPTDLSTHEFDGSGLMYQRKIKALERELDFQLQDVCDSNSSSLSPSAEKLHGSSQGSIDASTESAGAFGGKCMSPGRQVLELMSGLVQPISHPSKRQPYHAQSVPPKSPEKHCHVRQSTSSHSLAKSPQSASKEERIIQDKQAVQRFHNSLRRNHRKPDRQMDFEASGSVFGFQADSDPHPTFSEPQDEDTVRSYAVEGTPLMSHVGSTNDIRTIGQELTSIGRELNGVKSSSGSPKKVNLESEDGKSKSGQKSVTIASPMVFSRHSSVQSLDSFDEKSLYSNVQSAYSTQMPTGLVSPSDLPDSPTQTSPQSPKRQSESKAPTPPPHMSAPGPALDDSPISNASSLSALTIDTDTKVKPSRRLTDVLPQPPKPEFDDYQNSKPDFDDDDDPDYATFDPGRESDLLEQSIQAAKPAPPKYRNTNLRFGPPTRADQPFLGNYGNFGGSLEDENDCVKTYNYEGDGTPGTGTSRHTRNPSDCPSPAISSVSGPSSRAEPASQALNDFIRSAMPKPHVGISPKHRGKNVAIAKPMVRKSPSVPVCDPPIKRPLNPPPIDNEEEEKTTVFAVEGTPRNRSRSASPARREAVEPKRGSRQSPRGSKSVESLSSEDLTLDKCISDALPKPKPKKGRKSLPTTNGHIMITKQLLPPDSWTDAKIQEIQNEKGILEASGFSSMLMQSSSGFGASSMEYSAVSNLEDTQPPEGFMQVSLISGCSLMRSENTSEKVNDASNLLMQAVSNNSSHKQAFSECQPSTCAAIKQSSEGSECLSEDNYSRNDDDFDISPQDVDLNLVEEDANRVVLQFEGGNSLSDLDIISNEELLIECETLSLVSNSSRFTDQYQSDSEPNCPIICIPGKGDLNQPKSIRGGKKVVPQKLAASLAGPKMAVRTTKTAQLRAKKASESSTEGLSPPKDEIKKESAPKRSPRPKKENTPTPPKKEATPKLCETKKFVKKIIGKAPPPVPPKPKKYQPQKVGSFVRMDSPAVDQAQDEIPPDPPKIVYSDKNGPTSVLVSPFNYQQPEKKNKIMRPSPPNVNKSRRSNSRSSASPARNETLTISAKNKAEQKENEEVKGEKPSSKRLLVTTV